MSKAAEYRKRKTERKEPDLTGEITLPSGAVWTMRRPPLEKWTLWGKVPQSFLTAMMGMQGKTREEIQQVVGEASAGETMAAIGFIRDAILYAAVDPKLKVGARPEDDALDPADIEPEDFEFLCQWIGANCPGVPVKTKGGATSVESLGNFRQKRPGGGYVGDGDDLPKVVNEAINAAAAA